MAPLKLTHWMVNRSGPALTVTGLDLEGRKVRLTKVDRVESRSFGQVAVHRDGTVIELA